MRTKYEHLSKPPRIDVRLTEHPKAEMLGLCLSGTGPRNLMNAWSDYLREQADIADRYARTMTTAETVKEFVDIAESFRRDAEDANPTYKH
jgi:hypothetical protein